MPRHKLIPSLYEQCIRIFYNLINYYCENLELKRIKSKETKLKNLHSFLRRYFPTSILDDLLELHNQNNDHHKDPSLKSYYFYRAVTHPYMKRFTSRNYKLKLCYWRCLFENVFINLTRLNLALSCNDQILELIPIYCPNLEFLNATCKYERIIVGANACTFALSVTDFGLSFLCKCRRLRVLTVNEPRSHNRCRLSGITYSGLRKLLIEVPTIEDISYTDLGSVVSEGLQHLPSLNLRVLRHFSATKNSIQEILRLCIDLQELYLTFFNNDVQNDVWSHIINSNLKLKKFEVVNLNCDQYFSDIFKTIGAPLSTLLISNSSNFLTFSNIVTIGRYCKNLKIFSCCSVHSENEMYERPKNLGQFSNLESLYIQGENINIENVLIFCTENAYNLQSLHFINQIPNRICVDGLFSKYISSKELRHIEVSVKLRFSNKGIRDLLKKFPLLNYLNIGCSDDDYRTFMQEIRDYNYDLVFINKTRIPFVE